MLINRAHTDKDIYLPIDARERRWVDAIDGRRRAGDLPSGADDAALLRAFLERLWQHDQIAIATQRAKGDSGAPK